MWSCMIIIHFGLLYALWQAKVSCLIQESEFISAEDRNIPKREFDALYALYNATDGDNWTWPPIEVGPISGMPWTFTPDANPCTPGWYGIECTVGDSLHVKSIILPSQNLTGTLPEAIGSFPYLEKLEMRHNPKLTGSIPDVFGNFTKLRGIDLSHNNLTGSIPASIGEDTLLESLVMYGNALNSTVPVSICNLTLLYEVNFANNYLHGSIPSCIDQLTQMRGFTFSYNNLTGSIPASLGNLTQLGGIDFDNNDLTGTIPATLGNLVNLAYIAVYVNKLSGPLPTSLCNLTRLYGLYFYNNTLTGQIPNCWTQLVHLQTFDANENHFSGTLPGEVLSMPELRDFSVRNSRISGPVPVLFGPSLLIIELANNHLTGTLPADVFSLPILTTLEVSQNYLTGTIPHNINNSVLTFTVDLGKNHFTGTIPWNIGDCRALQFLLLDSNHLHGELPSSLKRLRELTELNVESNFLTGNLVNAINSTIHVVLKTILLNDNQFSGQIPDDLYLLQNLQVFAAVGNCFYSRLTKGMCHSRSLVTIALDGMRSGRACRTTLLGLTDSYYLQHPLEQSIPPCLFEMTPLNTLHLSGNGLTGTLPSNISISPTLSDLSLSHNQLRGVIPHRFQSNHWTNLDLSYNRFTGTLIKSFAERGNLTFLPTSLSLENNRLSGKIPHSLLHLKKLSILGTNIFACNQQRSNLPKADPGRETYHCASNSFDVPYFAWLILVGICMTMVMVTIYAKDSLLCGKLCINLKQHLQKTLSNIHDASLDGSTASLRTVLRLFENICTIAVVTMMGIVVVLVPLYLAVAGPFGTYYHQYAWQASAALLTGRTIAVVLMILWIILLCVIIAFSYYYQRQEKKRTTEQQAENRKSRPTSRILSMKSTLLLSWFDRCLVYALFMSISLCVVIGVNILYVYVVLYKDTKVVVLMQILLAMFKLFWSNFCSEELMHWTAKQISKSIEATESVYGREFHFVQLFVSLLNNLAIPCVVVAVVSPNCFYNVFVPPPTVRANYVYSRALSITLSMALAFSLAMPWAKQPMFPLLPTTTNAVPVLSRIMRRHLCFSALRRHLLRQSPSTCACEVPAFPTCRRN